MPLKNIRPLHILWQETLDIGQLDGAIAGAECALSSAGVSKEIKLKYMGQRRQPDWLSQNGIVLNPYQSLDWHIETARKYSDHTGYLNGATLLDSLRDNPSQETDPRYELVILKKPIHSGNHSKIFGLGRKGQGAIISLDSHLSLLQAKPDESAEAKEKRLFNFWLSTKLNAMHELGHVFGLFPGNSAQTELERERAHCLNKCVMYWQEYGDLYEKIANQPFCPSCLEKLKKYFSE
mgnify:CR=1 FL=1